MDTINGTATGAYLKTSRVAGVLLIVMVIVMLIGLGVGPVGIGADEQYFRDDFPQQARQAEQRAMGLIPLGALGLTLIAAGAGLSALLRTRSPWLAILGGYCWLASGTLLLLETTIGRSLYTLAGQWTRGGGSPGDALWTTAQGVALIYEALAGVALVMLVLGVFGFGLLITITRALPRWSGMIGVAAGAVVIVSFMVAPFGEGGWWLLMVGVVLALVWCLVSGVWLTFFGVPRADQTPVEPR